MLERLLENWLDSASERSYQAPFCQILAAAGHRVVHSTRHNPIEFGKDIITIAPDGVPCAYQLKGNPGGRLTLDQFRKIQPQLWQLATQAIAFPGVPNVMHRSYLVTNGYVEEDVQKSLVEMNTQFANGPRPCPCIELITKGNLLDSAKTLGSDLWPSEPREIRTLLDLLIHDGRDLFPAQKLHDLLVPLLFLEEELGATPNKREARRRITSAALLVATALQEFSRVENHYAIASAWSIYQVYVIAICERLELDFEEVGKASVEIASGAVLDALCALCDEIGERRHLVEGNSVTDFLAYHWRMTLVRGLLSLLWLWLGEENDEDARRRRGVIERFLKNSPDQIECWGEAAIPQILVHLWYRRKAGGAIRAEVHLLGLLAFLTAANLGKGAGALANPYWDFVDVFRHVSKEFLGLSEDPMQGESTQGSSFFAEGLFQLAVRAGEKQACKQIWPDLTKLGCMQFVPEHTWRYCLLHSEHGVTVTSQMAPTQEWQQVVNEANDVSCSGVPEPLKKRPLLLMLFVILFPYRGRPGVVRYLDSQLAGSPRA